MAEPNIAAIQAEISATINARMGDDPLRFLLNIVEEFTPDELVNNPMIPFIIFIARDRLGELGRPEEFVDFVIAKNIKIFGGINQYVDDYFRPSPSRGINPIDYVLSLPNDESKAATVMATSIFLRKLLAKAELSAANRLRIENAINRLNPNMAAPAAGGARRGRSRRRRRSTRSRR